MQSNSFTDIFTLPNEIIEFMNKNPFEINEDPD